MKPPESTSFFDLPTDGDARHEAAIDIFGRHLFAIRNSVAASIRANVNAPQESRNQMGRLHRVEYDAAATLSVEDREIALQLAQKSVDLFIQWLLTLFQCNGLSTDLKAGDQHAIAYEVLLTFIRNDDLEPIETHTVNKDGEKIISEYFGRWLHRYGKE